MKNTFSLTIALPAQHLLTFEAKRIKFPAIDGYMGFMAKRKPLIAAMGIGLIHIVDVEDEEYWFGTTGGFCEMLDNKAILLCDSLIRPEDAEKIDFDPAEPLLMVNTDEMNEKQKVEFVSKILASKLFKLEQQQEQKD